MSSNFRYQPFLAVSGNLGGKVPIVDDVLLSDEQQIYLTTSLDENCIEFEFQTDRNYYVDLRQTYLALKLKHVRGRGYQTYNTKEVKKEHREKAKAEEEEMAEEEAPVPLVTYVNNILHSMFSLVELYISNQQIHNSNGLYAHKSYLSDNFGEFLHCDGYDYEEFPDLNMEAPSTEPFFTRRKKTLSRFDDFLLHSKLGVDFFSTSQMLYPKMENSVRLIRATTDIYMISDNTKISLGIVDSWKLWQRLSTVIPDKTSPLERPISTMLQFVGLLLQRIQTVHSLNLILEIHSGINISISDRKASNSSEKPPTFICNLKDFTRWLLQVK